MATIPAHLVSQLPEDSESALLKMDVVGASVLQKTLPVSHKSNKDVDPKKSAVLVSPSDAAPSGASPSKKGPFVVGRPVHVDVEVKNGNGEPVNAENEKEKINAVVQVTFLFCPRCVPSPLSFHSSSPSSL
jgi:hypothetical protein